MAFLDNGKLTPDNIFAGRVIESDEKKGNNKGLDGLPVYSKSQAEAERKKLVEKSNERIRTISTAAFLNVSVITLYSSSK